MIMESKMYQDSFKNFQIMTLLMRSDQRKAFYFNNFYGEGVQNLL